MSLPLTFKRGRWHLEISEGETVTAQPFQELFNPRASETEQSVQSEEGHDSSLTRFPSFSVYIPLSFILEKVFFTSNIGLRDRDTVGVPIFKSVLLLFFFYFFILYWGTADLQRCQF